MRTSQEKVLDLVARGQLTPDQADDLLAAMTHRRARLRRLVHPLDAMSIGSALLASALAALASVALGVLGTRFDGALDLHVGPRAVPLATSALDVVAWWALPSAVLWLGLRGFARAARFIDFLAAVGIAHVPYVLAALPLIAIARPASADPARMLLDHPARMAASAVIGLCALAWLLTLLYTGVKTAAGLAGRRFALGFAGLLVLAEILSKLALAARPA